MDSKHICVISCRIVELGLATDNIKSQNSYEPFYGTPGMFGGPWFYSTEFSTRIVGILAFEQQRQYLILQFYKNSHIWLECERFGDIRLIGIPILVSSSHMGLTDVYPQLEKPDSKNQYVLEIVL